MNSVHPKEAQLWLMVWALDLAVLLFVAWQAWFKPLPLPAYLVAVAFLGLITAGLVFAGSANRVLVLVHLVAIAFLVRGVYFLSTHFSVLPHGDAYGMYGVLQAFLSEGKLFLIDSGGFIDRHVYSGWPAIHLLAIATIRVTGLGPFNVALFLPWVFFSVWIALSYALLRRLVQDLGLPDFTMFLAVLVLAAMPSIMVPEYKHQYMAWSLFAAILYLLYRQIRQPSVANGVALLALVVALTITHHYTSLITAICLLALAAVAVAVRLVVREDRGALALLPSTFVFTVFCLGAIQVAALFVWWNTYATPGRTIIGWGFEGFGELLQTGVFKPWTYAVESTTKVPSVLVPPWGMPVLLSRDLVMLASAILGGLLLMWRSRQPSATVSFVAYLLFIVVTLGVIDIFVTKQAPYRVFWYFAPFGGLVVAVAFTFARRWWRARFSIAASGALILIVFASLVGLWAHFYVPTHLYDPTVSPQSAGEHAVGWRRLQGFCGQYLCYEEADRVITDDIYALTLAMPSGHWDKAAVVGFEGAQLSDKSVVVSFRDFDARTSYINQGETWLLDPGYSEAQFRDELEHDSNLIYDDGSYKVWSSNGVAQTPSHGESVQAR